MNDKNINLKLARVAKDLSQDQLAELVKASRQTINLIETGKYNPTIELCLRICWALDKSLDELFWKNKEDLNNAN
ncbi:MAG: transcriptional regulator [Clostridiaceae bacterium]|jgi:putative transcriptional regulator|nr:transcriptional regulator [Clostridiaceae bacterium]MDF2950464.1 transcriptional regulator [Anaerocolumna sp.]